MPQWTSHKILRVLDPANGSTAVVVSNSAILYHHHHHHNTTKSRRSSIMMETAELVVDKRGRRVASEHSRSHNNPRPPPSSTSKKTPRRSNPNPQSSSPPRQREDEDDGGSSKNNKVDDNITHDDDGEQQQQQQQPQTTTSTTSFASPLNTPLSTLATLLSHSHNYQQSTLHLFRTSHSLHLHATDRKKKATDALRLAQAELEHATTAEEFAVQELRHAKITKNDANDQYVALRKDVTKLATQYKGERVVLVNLTGMTNWNGREGTIVQLITDTNNDGTSTSTEDIGRWKVKLDSDWRGKEPDGNYSPFEGGGMTKMLLSQDRQHVVAKAENLELIECHHGNHMPSFWGGGRRSQEAGDQGAKTSSDDKSRSKSRSSSMSLSLPDDDSRRRDEDDNKGKKHHPLDPVEELPESHVVTPERRGGRRRIYNTNNHQLLPSSPPQQQGAEYDWKRSALGSQYSPPGYYDEPDNPSFVHRHAPLVMHHLHPQKRLQSQQPQQKQLQRIHSHQQHQPQRQQLQQQQLQQQQQHYSSPRMPPKRSPNSPSIMQQHMYDRNRVSSSFSEMVSPERFEPVSFQIEASESFRLKLCNDASLPSASFFEEVSPHEQDAQNVPSEHRYRYQEESNEERNDSGGHSSQAPSTHYNSLPTVDVILMDNEEGENNDGPPNCVGVQNAGISHVNGVYVLAPNESPNSSASNADAPPLYFRDGEPILLSDGRYYDMCILRIDCPDSPEFVIWFLSRVNIDPNCLDVKFSDCYYYCRVLRSGGGLHVPPTNGWNIPDVQPGAVAFSTAEAEEISSMKSGHRSEEKDQTQLLHSSVNSGIGIVPRAAETGYV